MFKQDGDGYLDTEGCYWDSLGSLFYSGLLDMCSCGYAATASELMMKALVACDDWVKRDAPWPLDIVTQLVKDTDPRVIAEILLHILDSKGLTEHGTTVSGSWLDDKGKEWIAFVSSLPSGSPF